MEKAYNGWVGHGDRESAWATWNMALWIDNEYTQYRDRELVNPTTADEVREFCLGYYPKGTPDMDAGDVERVNWSEIATAWGEV